MIKHNYFVKFLKKINLTINNLLKEYLNKLNFKKFSNLAQSNKFFLTFVALIILFVSYLSIPNIYTKAKIHTELKKQLLEKFNLNFNLSPSLIYKSASDRSKLTSSGLISLASLIAEIAKSTSPF